jgi:transcriptional regulator with XRE-family HTH domain
MSLERPTKLSRIMGRDGVPLTHVAQHCGVDDSSVCRWRLGRARPRADAARRLELLFDCPVDELLRPMREPMTT